jgi:hypothetical protein
VVLDKLNLARQQALNKLCGNLPMLAATYRKPEPSKCGSGHLETYARLIARADSDCILILSDRVNVPRSASGTVMAQLGN